MFESHSINFVLIYTKGNQNIHHLTRNGFYELRVELSDYSNNRRYASYGVFFVGDASSSYRLRVGAYEGNAGTICNMVI